MADSKPSSLRKNLTIQGLKDGLSLVIFLGLTAVIARALGVDRFGQLAWAETLVAILSNFGDLGLSRAMMVFVAQARGRGETRGCPEITAAFWARLAFMALLLTVGITSIFIPKPEGFELYGSNLFQIALMTAACGLCERHVNAVMQGLERFDWLAITRLGRIIAYAITIVVLVLMGWLTAETALLSVAIGQLTGTAIGGFFLLGKQRYRLVGAPSRAGFRALTGVSSWTLVSVVAVTIFERADILMLGSMIGETAIGIYNAGQKANLMMTRALGSFLTVLFPKIAAMRDPDKVAELLRLIFRRSLYVTFALLPIYVLAPYWVTLYFGEEFARSSFIFQLLFIRFLTQLYINHFGHVFYAFNRPWIVAGTNICQAIANIIGNLWLIPIYAEAGAAIATLMTALPAIVLFTLGLRWTLSKARETFEQEPAAPTEETSQ